MLAQDKKDRIRRAIRKDQIQDLAELAAKYPEVTTWELRTLLAEERRERIAAAVIKPHVLREMTARGREAFAEGMFDTPAVTLPRPTLLSKPVFPKVGGTLYGVISDLHAGTEHDYAALDVAVQIMQAAGVDELIVNGDLYDCEAFSRHTPSAEQHMRWIEERTAAMPAVAYLRSSFPKHRIRMNYGNHDLRPTRWISANATVLEGLFDLSYILGLEQFGIEVEPTGRIVIADKVLIKHGTKVSQDAGMSTKKEIMASFMTTVMGHVHRLAYTETRKGYHDIHNIQPTQGIELGCLCSLRPKYVAEEDTLNWSQGFALLRVAEDGHISTELVPIHQGRADFRGLTFRSRLLPGSAHQSLDASQP
jgi:predicted phosphodiesterase